MKKVVVVEGLLLAWAAEDVQIYVPEIVKVL
jgi:hypothetical protein